MTERRTEQFSIRINKELKDKIVAISKNERRSISNLIETLLEESLRGVGC